MNNNKNKNISLNTFKKPIRPNTNKMPVQHSPPRPSTTRDSGLNTINLDNTESENKTTDERITNLVQLIENFAAAGERTSARTLQIMENQLEQQQKTLTDMITDRFAAMQLEINTIKNTNNDKEINNIQAAETENKLKEFNNRFNNLENQLRDNTNQQQEELRNQITNQLNQQTNQMKENNDKFGKEIRKTINETMENIHMLNTAQTPALDNSNEARNNGIQQPPQTSINNNSQPRNTNVSEDDRISKKQALSLLSSGKIPIWNESESLKKFLKNTVKIFAEDSNQKPVHIAMWIHKCFASQTRLQPQRLKDIATEIISDDNNISINSFLKQFGENLQPSETTPFNFKRESNETVQDAVYRLLEEYDSIDTKHIAQALVINESDRWIQEFLKQKISFSGDITEKQLKEIAKNCDKECRVNLNKNSSDKIIELDYFRNYIPNINQRQRSQNQNYSQNYRPQQTLYPKFCESCKEKFVPRFGIHKFCNDCFYNKIINQNNRNNYQINKNQNRPNRPFYQPNTIPQRPISQSNQTNNRYRNVSFDKPNRKTIIRNFNSNNNTIRVMNLNDLADQIYNIEESLKSRLGIEIPAKNDYNEIINCFGLLDSGANKNVVAENFLTENNISFRRKRPTYAETANPNAKIDIIGTASIKFGRNNEICNFEVTKQNLGENSSFDFILGTPFLENIGVMDQIRQSAEEYSIKNM